MRYDYDITVYRTGESEAIYRATTTTREDAIRTAQRIARGNVRRDRRGRVTARTRWAVVRSAVVDGVRSAKVEVVAAAGAL